MLDKNQTEQKSRDRSIEDLIIKQLNKYHSMYMSICGMYKQIGLDVYNPPALQEWLAKDRDMIFALIDFADREKCRKLNVRLSEIGFAHVRFGLSGFIQD